MNAWLDTPTPRHRPVVADAPVLALVAALIATLFAVVLLAGAADATYSDGVADCVELGEVLGNQCIQEMGQ